MDHFAVQSDDDLDIDAMPLFLPQVAGLDRWLVFTNRHVSAFHNQ